MASITPRKNKAGEIISYTIRVYRGYDINGNRLKPYLMTWKPDRGMTDRQIQNELQRQALELEKKCENGEAATSNIKLGDFCTQYLEAVKTFLSPGTLAAYQSNIRDFIKPALGHLKVKALLTFSSIYSRLQNCRNSRKNPKRQKGTQRNGLPLQRLNAI